jgi:hypothetical protein
LLCKINATNISEKLYYLALLKNILGILKVLLFVFGQRFPGEEGSVRKCVVVMQQPVFVAKVRGEVFSHFHAVTVKCYSSMWNCLFGLP